jgi:hypothetical protein
LSLKTLFLKGKMGIRIRLREELPTLVRGNRLPFLKAMPRCRRKCRREVKLRNAVMEIVRAVSALTVR